MGATDEEEEDDTFIKLLEVSLLPLFHEKLRHNIFPQKLLPTQQNSRCHMLQNCNSHVHGRVTFVAHTESSYFAIDKTML
jgi:hypothetical protein